MAVMQNSITFGGVNSADYGIYIGGEGVFNAPTREVEMISIPGRNGAFALDHGRFENITVTYSAFNYEEDLDTFAERLSAFRNAICSQKGYQQLTDTFHPAEYRMATVRSGLEFKPVQYNTAAKFDIVFDCMPQRWLAEGETKITVADGDTITNPTMFDASPLLEVEGYGRISINGDTITIDDGDYGEMVSTPFSSTQASGEITFSEVRLNTGDSVYLNNLRVVHTAAQRSGYSFQSSRTVSVTDGATASIDDYGKSRKLNVAETALTYGTTYSATYTASYTLSWRYGGRVSSGTASLTLALSYDGAHTISYSITYEIGTPFTSTGMQITAETVRAESTVSALGHPTYIDLNIGVAWNEDDNTVTSMNNVVELPALLPTLKAGTNFISFDSTIEDLKITPRWWKV